MPFIWSRRLSCDSRAPDSPARYLWFRPSSSMGWQRASTSSFPTPVCDFSTWTKCRTRPRAWHRRSGYFAMRTLSSGSTDTQWTDRANLSIRSLTTLCSTSPCMRRRQLGSMGWQSSPSKRKPEMMQPHRCSTATGRLEISESSITALSPAMTGTASERSARAKVWVSPPQHGAPMVKGTTHQHRTLARSGHTSRHTSRPRAGLGVGNGEPRRWVQRCTRWPTRRAVNTRWKPGILITAPAAPVTPSQLTAAGSLRHWRSHSARRS